MIPDDPTERDILAAEYVLGTLEARQAGAVARALQGDANLRGAVAIWEARLAPLTSLAVPEAPPPDLWARIEATLPVARGAVAPGRARASASSGMGWLWRGWAVGASAAAAGLAAFVVLRPVPPPPLMTVLLTSFDQPAWLVEADPGGAIRLASLNTQPVQPDRVLQLWALPQGATVPTSLGLIPAGGQVTVTPATIRPEPNMLIEITLEPPGGSPTGRPTGPIQFIGRLGAARAS
jgi:anti-sigma-K factor RskA